jgi:hypothetical protein
MRLHIAVAFLSGALAQNNQTSSNLLGGGMMGSNFCTYSPNTTCFPSTGGFPPCCAEDPKPEGCGTGEYPECEKPAVSCSYNAYAFTNMEGFVGEEYCTAYDFNCGRADKTKANRLTATDDSVPYPIVPSMDDLMFYKTFNYQFQFNNTQGDPYETAPEGSGSLFLTSSPDGNVTGVCTKPSKITWQLEITDNSGDYFVCQENNGLLIPPTACCEYIFCDDGGQYVDASTCASLSVGVETVPKQGPVVLNFQIDQSKSDCKNASGTYVFRPALLGITIAALSFLN